MPGLVDYYGPFSLHDENTSEVGLRVFRDGGLDPEEVSRLLGHEQSRAYTREGVWVLDSPVPDSEGLEGQIAGLLDLLTEDLSDWARAREEYKMDLFCGLFITGDSKVVQFSPALLQRLADRGLSLGLEAWNAQDEEGVEYAPGGPEWYLARPDGSIEGDR